MTRLCSITHPPKAHAQLCLGFDMDSTLYRRLNSV